MKRRLSQKYRDVNKSARCARGDVARKIAAAAICAAFLFSLLSATLFISFAASPGDVVINEFSSDSSPEWVELLNTTANPIDLDGWKLTQLTTPQGTPTEVDLLSLSGTIPAGGILVFDVGVSKLNNLGDSIGLYDNTPTLMHRVTYGTVTGVATFTVERLFPGEFDNTKYSLTLEDPEGLSEFLIKKANGSFIWGGEPKNSTPSCPSSITSDTVTVNPSDFPLSGYVVDCDTGAQNSVQASMPPLPDGGDSHSTKGWFNGSPAIADIVASINAGGVTTNWGTGDIPDSSAATGLYFDKAGAGRVTFTSTLNLTDPDTTAFLQDLGSKMEASAGSMKFDARTAQALKDAGAEIKLYGLDVLGFGSTPNLIVKDDEGNVIDPGTVDYPEITVFSYAEGTLTFTTDHFTQFEVDENVYVSSDDGDDENDGTKDNPYQTIQKGIDSVPITGTVNVASGEYGENLGIEKSLTLLGDPGGEEAGPGENAPTIIDNGDCDSRLISIEENDVAVQGFILDGSGCERPVVRIRQGVRGATISDNEIRQGRKGVDLSPESSENTVAKNLIHDNENEGVWIGGSRNNTISENEIHSNGTGIGLGRGGSCDEECGNVSGNEITGNNIHNNNGNGGIYSGGSEITFTELTIAGNQIADNGNYGIYFDRITNSSLTIGGDSESGGNTVTGNGSAGVYLSGDSGGIVNSRVSVKNNTINNSAHEGIYVSRVDQGSTLDVTHNTITGNDKNEDEEGYAGVYISNVFASSTVTLLDNVISAGGSRGAYVCAGECVSSTLTFRSNTIEDNNSDGILVYELRSSTLNVFDNIIRGTAGPGFELGYVGRSPIAPSTVTVSENTFDDNFYGIYIGGDTDEDADDDDSTIAIGEDNIIKNNSNTGIYLGEAVFGVTITGNTIQNNGVESETTGIVVFSASGNEAHENIISGNGSHGVSNEDGEGNVFDAEQNWWGDVSGPLHETENTDGAGNEVSGNVVFSPWFANEAMTILGNTTATGEDDNPAATLPSAIATTTSTDVGSFTVQIPEDIVITGPSGWDGTIHLPSVATTTVQPVPDEGNDASDAESIEIGFGSTLLTFNKGVRLLFAGKAGKDIGYSHGAGTFTKITNICSADSQEAGDALPAGGDCKINNDPDLVVWTKHFSTFTTYTQSPTPAVAPPPAPASPSGGVGGAFILPPPPPPAPPTPTTTPQVQVLGFEFTPEEIDAFVAAERGLTGAINQLLVTRLLGRILLQVEQNGEAWFLDPVSRKRNYLPNGDIAYQALRTFGLGITDANLEKIPVGIDKRFADLDGDNDGLSDKMEEGLGTNPASADTDGDGRTDGDEVANNLRPNGAGSLPASSAFTNRLKGRILLQVQQKGQAWYLNPADGKRYYIQDGAAAYKIMRFLSLGITNKNLSTIPIGILPK